jgi:hypothetical protein
MFNPITYITIWEEYPILFKIVLNIYKVLVFLTTLFLVINISDEISSFKYWNISSLSTIITFGLFVRRVLRSNENISRNIVGYIFYSIVFKFWSIIGIVWYNNSRINSEYKNVYFKSLIFYNIFSFYDLLYLFLSCSILQLNYSGYISRISSLEDLGLSNSELIDYNDELEGTMCTICLDTYDENKFLSIRKTKCGHIYHNDCIIPWFNISNSCPTCRYKFKTVILES